MRKVAMAARTGLVVGLLAGLLAGGCDDYRSPEQSPPPMGLNKHGDHIPDKNAPLRADVPHDVYRIVQAENEVVLVPIVDGAKEGGEVQPQSGHEIRLTPQEFTQLVGGDMRGEGIAREGMRVRVIRDANGQLSKFAVEGD